MKFIGLFEDNPDADPDIRNTHMSRHLAFLEAHRDTVLAAGPLVDAADSGARRVVAG